ncbi:hypothetical protein NBO_31gi002 [Nosema bombycis CQ1]|uniref:Mechanosensitive ion channel MscS domain-containing protein n=1 Tax=Nosema bombycis (strain CQ1 / CVCC 102059) TaxID=578461 RepID=R0KVQ4_NOSB1|nr:hypothetical protein NBO_31gi002 [Nosema bombycis CQ1]|eukprot:EOB14292.1 hypothetical protein NBO_31gi002 [Nosema bombycis CQ1]
MPNTTSLRSTRLKIVNIDEALKIKDDIEIVYKKKSKMYIGYVIGLLLVLIGCIYLYSNKVLSDQPTTTHAERIAYFKYEIIFYLLAAITIWVTTHLFLSILNNINHDEYSVFSTILNNHDNYINFVITSIGLSSLILLNTNYLKRQEDDASNITLFSYFIDIFPNLFIGSSIFLLIVFIKDIVVYMAIYKMHFSSYKDRIKANRKDLRMLEALNRSSGLNMYENVGDWARFVFSRISGDQKSIIYEDLNNKFHTEVIQTFYKFFRSRIERKITEKEFVMMYKAIIRERQQISEIFVHKQQLVSKLNLIMSILIYPLALLCMQNVIGLSFKSLNVVKKTQLFLSFSFIFAGVVTEVFNSLVFTFLVRSFDIGDRIMIEDKIYKVLDIGIMFTEFFCNGKNVLISNVRLRKEKIINFRLCALKQTEFIFNLNSKNFEEEKKILKEGILKYQKKNKKFYKAQCTIKKIKEKEISVLMTYKLKHNKLEKIAEEENDFKIFMHTNLLKT